MASVRGLLNLLMPGLLAVVSLIALRKRVDVYDALSAGAREGLQILLRVFPPLVGLMTAVHLLRASGLLDGLAALLAPLLHRVGIAPELLPLMLIRPVSGSGALGVGADLIRTRGPDSLVGRTAAVMLGSTETTFYTITVYFGAAGVRDTRYAIPAALCADLAGFLTASWVTRLMYGP